MAVSTAAGDLFETFHSDRNRVCTYTICTHIPGWCAVHLLPHVLCEAWVENIQADWVVTVRVDLMLDVCRLGGERAGVREKWVCVRLMRGAGFWGRDGGDGQGKAESCADWGSARSCRGSAR